MNIDTLILSAILILSVVILVNLVAYVLRTKDEIF